MSAFSVIAEALARVEYKLDLAINGLKILTEGKNFTCKPMEFTGHACPVCLHPVSYEVDIPKCVVVRRCECKTGKLPPTIPLTPVETKSGDKKHEFRYRYDDETDDSDRSKEG